MITIVSVLIVISLAVLNQFLPYFSPRISLAFRYDEGGSPGPQDQGRFTFRALSANTENRQRSAVRRSKTFLVKSEQRVI
jgi:hypothetical protein